MIFLVLERNLMVPHPYHLRKGVRQDRSCDGFAVDQCGPCGDDVKRPVYVWW